MGSLYYTDAAQLLRDAGITVVECDGWKTRARSSGGFASAPLGIQWHHTASSTSPENDTAWQTEGSDDAPIGNGTIMRDGSVWLVAAGASNTAGKGGALKMSRGTVPLDSGNSTTWAWEVANNGVGEPWPQVQIDTYFKASIVMNKRFGNQPDDIFTHTGWCEPSCPGRKIDPAKADAVQGPWKPRSINSSGTWNQDDCRTEIRKRAGAPTTTPPPTTHPPEHIQGIDVSKWQGDIDWAQVKAAGYQWVAIRTWDRQAKPPAVDVTFDNNRKGMAFAKWRFLYYWLEPGRVDVGVDEFFKSIGALQTGEGVMLDAEEDGITVDECIAWCEKVEAKTGVPCAVYTGAYAAGGTIWRSTALFNGHRARVFAAYATEDEALEHADGIEWDGWQYSATGKVPGVDADCDLDRIDNPEAFDRCTKGGATHPPEPTPPPTTGDKDMAAIMPTIKKGDKGDYVERMQHLLAAAGFMEPGNVKNYDGVWGDGTDGAKKKFDNAFGLASSNTDCGAKSWESLLTGKHW